MPKKITEKRVRYDWEAIEKEYRLGQKSIRNIAAVYGISHQAISKRIKKEKWVQDKTKEVQEKTRAGLISCQRQVAKKVATPTPGDIEKAVKTNIEVVLTHRKYIRKGRELVDMFFDQLRDVGENREEYEDLIVKDTKGENGEKPQLKRRNSMLKAVSLPMNSATLRDLSTALHRLIPLERQAFNLDDAGDDLDDLKSTLTPEEKKLFRKAAKIVSQRVIEQAHE